MCTSTARQMAKKSGFVQHDTFEQLIQPFKYDLLRYCKRLAGSNWDGEDLYQEAVIKAFKRYQRWPERDLSKPYLFRIASNSWIDICRREQFMILPEALTEVSAVSYSEWSRYDIRETLEWLMDSLEPRQVALILLVDVFGFTPKETEAALGQPVTAIKSALYRARQRLRKEAQRQLLNVQNGTTARDKTKPSVDSDMQDRQEWFNRFTNAFLQADVGTLVQSYQALTKAGITVDRIFTLQQSVFFYFTDPDGNPLMIRSKFKR